MQIKIAELEILVLQALEKKYSKGESEKIAKVILFGELSNKKTHGVVRLLVGKSCMLAQNPTSSPSIIKKTNVSKIVEGNANPAMLVASIAMDEAIGSASTHGFGLVVTNKTFSTSGCLSYYLEQIARNNLIGIVMARSESCVAPFGSIEALFGTNPIGFTFPTNSNPLIFDMGTSIISFGQIYNCAVEGKSLPEKVALDKNGEFTIDPNEAMNGAIVPFDRSYKSSGLSMMVELLAGTLSGAGFIDQEKENGWGNFFVCIKPDLLMDIDVFKTKIDRFVERLKSAKTKDGMPIRIPGENTLKHRDEALAKGVVEVSDELMNKLKNYIHTGKLN